MTEIWRTQPYSVSRNYHCLLPILECLTKWEIDLFVEPYLYHTLDFLQVIQTLSMELKLDFILNLI